MIRSCFPLLLAFGFAGAVSAREVPEDLRSVVRSAEVVGTQIYVHDTAAWRATDELNSRGILQADTRLRGWLTDAGDGLVVVTFIGDVDGTPAALHRVTVLAGNAPMKYEAVKPAQPLAGEPLARWKARMAAMEALRKRDDTCAPQYNTVVLPFDPATGDLIRVYLLAATDKPGVMIAGGHFRYEYSADGERLVSQRGFTRGCFEIPFGTEKREKVEAITMTHLLDPSPTELHVFLSRSYHVPIMLMTTSNELLWVVDGSTIKLPDPPPPKAQP